MDPEVDLEEDKPANIRDQTIVMFDDDWRDGLVGYGTWAHVRSFGEVSQPRHIEIVFFGVCSRYQGQKDDKGLSVAGQLYATVEQHARAHDESMDEMPFTLACDVENERGRRFWEHRGYRLIPDPELQVENEGRYPPPGPQCQPQQQRNPNFRAVELRHVAPSEARPSGTPGPGAPFLFPLSSTSGSGRLGCASAP